MKEITQEMLALAAKGNQYAIEDLYRLTYNSVYKAAKALIQDEDTVLDIVQDSYVKAFQSLDQLDSPENFRAWIKRIASNKAKDYLKKKKPILFSEMANEDGEEFDFRDENLDHLPEEVLDRKETTRLMDEILGSLSEDQRVAIALHYYQDMSIKEIAELMGCSENTVKSRLNYGRKKVEVKVRELEKRGTKLYSLAPLPFLLWLFRMDAEAAEIPSGMVLEAVTAECAAAGTAAAGSAGAVSAKAAATAGVKSALTTKVAAGVLAVTIAGGGVAAAVSGSGPKEDFTHDEILSSYQEACRDNCKKWRTNRKDYRFLDDKIIESFHGSDAMNIMYCDHDLDGNGTEELLIGLYDPYQNWIELDCVYTFDDGYAVPAIACESLPAKSESEDSLLEELSLTRENKIFKHYGNGEGQFYYTLWQLSDDGVTMEQIGEFTEDITKDQVTFGGETISCHEFKMNYFETITHTLPWEILVPHPELSVQPAFQNPEEAEINPVADPREIYAPVLEQYQAVVTMDSATFLNAPDNYFNGDHMAIRYYHMYHGDNFYYAYMDIDGNGMEELLIGFGPEDYIRFVDLYGFDGERAVQLIDEPTLGDRSMLALLADGTLYLAGSSSATETSHTYLKVDGCSVKEVPDTIAERVTDIPWKAFDLPEIPVSEPFFDSVLVGMREALTMSTEDYDSNKEYYDSVYGHWGEGVPWMIMHRQAGDYTMCIWNTYLDINGDGQDELCIGRGVSPSDAAPIVIYKPNGEAIYGDAVYAYNDLFYGGAPIEWNYLGG